MLRITARKLLFFLSLSALLIGCSKQQTAPSNSPTYTRPSLGADRSLYVELDMNKLSETSLLYFVKSFGLSNNLVYRGTSPSKVTGTDSRIYALDESAVDSMALVLGIREGTNATLYAVYKGTNDFYFNSLKSSLRAALHNQFGASILKTLDSNN
jgi:hypothetical protein